MPRLKYALVDGHRVTRRHPGLPVRPGVRVAVLAAGWRVGPGVLSWLCAVG
jgi:hypothetical protein